MNSDFRILLEHIDSIDGIHRFRLAFEASVGRFLLPYPTVTGLQFAIDGSEAQPKWATYKMVTAPRDEFVLNPEDRIAFDLLADTNVDVRAKLRWRIALAPGEYQVHYRYEVRPETQRYDFLGKGSYFADMTKPWTGIILSNEVAISISGA